MQHIQNTLGAFLLLSLLFSCGGAQKDNIPAKINETPKALQENKLEFSRYDSTNDLTEELYQELVGNTPELKKLEDDLNAFRLKPKQLDAKFDTYQGKSNSYYSSSTNKAGTITDSLLRTKIISLITSSQSRYASKTGELNSLLKQISANGATIKDHHTILKIVLTLPLIEKFQDNNTPNKTEFKELIKQQEDFIQRIDSLTPIY